MRKLCALAVSLFLFGCVPLPEGYLSEYTNSIAFNAPVEGLGAGYKTKETAHFIVSSYGNVDAYADMCENAYAEIMRETALYSFVPTRPYNVTVYGNASEYYSKTKMPEWSGAVAYGNALLFHQDNMNEAIVAHEMTHLIFNEFMGLNNAMDLRWINEGAAVYMETKASRYSENAYSQRLKNQIVHNPIPFSQMINLAPQTESGQNVDRWYAQVWSVVSFMISRGGSFNFSVFLKKMKDGDTMDKSLSYAYNGKWADLNALENDWLLYISR